MPRKSFAVIPTHDRPRDFRDCLTAIAPQVDGVVVIANRAPYATDALDWSLPDVTVPWFLMVEKYPAHPPNISTMWNLGLDVCARAAGDDPYDVAVLNDDVIVPEDWFSTVTAAMRSRDAVLGGPPGVFDSRWVAGYAHILASESGLRYDEELRWWFSDTALHIEAAKIRGGVALVGRAEVEHRWPNSTTVGELAQIAGEDRERFVEKYGDI